MLVRIVNCSVHRAEAVFWGTWGQTLAQDYESDEFYRLFNKDNLVCLKNKANEHSPNEQRRGIDCYFIVSCWS